MVFIQIILLLFISSLAEEKTVFLLTIFRHGARAPSKYYNLSTHLDYLFEKWDNPGELTPTGRRMHYALGLRNREIYINQKHFLSEKFDPHEILVYSSNYNRTLESVASQLQGLYPFGTGAEITEEQKSNSIPPLNLSPKVKEELDKMNNDALPIKMSLVPIRMIGKNERKINVDFLGGCIKKSKEIIANNTENSINLKNLLEKFDKNYSQPLNKFYGTNEIKYEQNFISNFCDSFLAGYTEGKKFEKVIELGLNKEELLKSCIEYTVINYRDLTAGDKERVIPTLEVSKLMQEFIYYMKQRIDADINKEDIGKKLEDFSRPKMLMISAHDYTVSMWEMFLIKVFLNNDDSKFIFPNFAAQLAFEVITVNNTDSSNKKNYNDYTINCYFNDDLFFSKKVDEFIKLIESNIYNDDQINEYCQEIVFNSKKEEQPQQKAIYFYLMIVFITITGLLIILMIILIIKAKKSKNELSEIRDIEDGALILS